MLSQVLATQLRTTERVQRARLALVADEYRLAVGRAIRERRLSLGMTQKDLADATHYKEAQTVSRWERGENLPGDLSVVAAALNWTLSEMMRGVDPPDARTARKMGVELPQPEISPEDDGARTLARIERALAKQDKTLAAMRKTLAEIQSGAAQAINDFSAQLDELAGPPDPGSSDTGDP
jgi:transcriptional regulator with XRE-family HTH domain